MQSAQPGCHPIGGKSRIALKAFGRMSLGLEAAAIRLEPSPNVSSILWMESIASQHWQDWSSYSTPELPLTLRCKWLDCIWVSCFTEPSRSRVRIQPHGHVPAGYVLCLRLPVAARRRLLRPPPLASAAFEARSGDICSKLWPTCRPVRRPRRGLRCIRWEP